MAKVGKTSKARGRKTCCLVSEMLEEMGLDSAKARELRRQTLLGLQTFCQWQLASLDAEVKAPSRRGKAKGRRVRIV